MEKKNLETTNPADLLENLKAFAGVFVSLWDTGHNKDMEVYLKGFSGLIREHPDYNKLKKSWGITWRNELNSLANEIAGEHYSECKKLLKNPPGETYSGLVYLIDQKITKILSKQKEKDRSEWVGEKIKEHYERNGKDFIQDAPNPTITTPPPPSPEDRKRNNAAKDLNYEWRLVCGFCDCIRKAGGIKVNKSVGDLENYFRSDFKNNAQELLNDKLKGKSIYQIHKEKKVEFRRLLYTLKSIRFPMAKRKSGRYSNFITFKNLGLFEVIFPLIESMWEKEYNYKGWISYFKKKLGWEKSRITNFIKRRVKDGIVPAYFFEVLPSPPSEEQLRMLLKKDKNLAAGFIEIEKIFNKTPNDIPNRILTRQEIKTKLRKLTKTLLSKE